MNPLLVQHVLLVLRNIEYGQEKWTSLSADVARSFRKRDEGRAELRQSERRLEDMESGRVAQNPTVRVFMSHWISFTLVVSLFICYCCC